MSPIAFTNASLITGYESDGIKPGMSVMIDTDKGLIEDIQPTGTLKAPEGCRIIDLAGGFLMPGLINAHAHLVASGKPSLGDNKSTRTLLKLLKTAPGRALATGMIKKNVINAVNAGVTTIRGCGDPLYFDVAVRDEALANLKSGKGVIMPTLLVSGKLICASGGHGEMLTPLIADSPWEARRAVRLNDVSCVDHIKLVSTGGVTDARKIGQAGCVHMTVDEISALCDEAHRRGLMVAAHAESRLGVLEALQGGVDTIEHGADFDDESIALFQNNPKSLRGFSAYIPTLSAPDGILSNREKLTDWDEVKFSNADLVYDGVKAGFKKALDAGIKIGCGVDAGVPFVTHYNVWHELELFCETGGISPRRAIELATVGTAEAIGIADKTGSLESGKHADMIILGANPLEDISSLSQPQMVVAAGRLIEQPKVDRVKF